MACSKAKLDLPELPARAIHFQEGLFCPRQRKVRYLSLFSKQYLPFFHIESFPVFKPCRVFGLWFFWKISSFEFFWAHLFHLVRPSIEAIITRSKAHALLQAFLVTMPFTMSLPLHKTSSSSMECLSGPSEPYRRKALLLQASNNLKVIASRMVACVCNSPQNYIMAHASRPSPMQSQKKGFQIQNGKLNVCMWSAQGSFNWQMVCMQISTRRLLQMNKTFFSTGERCVQIQSEKPWSASLWPPRTHICLVAMTTLGFTQFKESIGGGRFSPRPFYMNEDLSFTYGGAILWETSPFLLAKKKQGACHTVWGPYHLRTWKVSILRQKKNYENSNISPCKNIIFKKSSKRNPNPSRYYYKSITNEPKYYHNPLCYYTP
jgi:hypothetical protein